MLHQVRSHLAFERQDISGRYLVVQSCDEGNVSALRACSAETRVDVQNPGLGEADVVHEQQLREILINVFRGQGKGDRANCHKYQPDKVFGRSAQQRAAVELHNKEHGGERAHHNADAAQNFHLVQVRALHRLQIHHEKQVNQHENKCGKALHNRIFAHEHRNGNEHNLGNTNHQFPELKMLVVEGRQEAHKLVVGHVLVDEHITAPARPQHQRHAARQNNAVYDDPDDGYGEQPAVQAVAEVAPDSGHLSQHAVGAIKRGQSGFHAALECEDKYRHGAGQH